MKLNDKQKFLAIILVGVLIVTGISYLILPLSQLQDYDYETGLTIDTETDVKEIRKTNAEPYKNSKFTQTVDKEIFEEDKYIVSWLPEEFSQLITMQCQFDYRPLWRDWWPEVETVSICRYYVTVDYIKTNGEKIRIIDTDTGVNNDGDMWDTNYVEMVGSRFPEESRHFTAGSHSGHLLPNIAYSKHPNLVDKAPLDRWYDVSEEIGHGSDWLKDWHELETDTFEFYIKGTAVGALEANYYLEWTDSDMGYVGWGLLYNWHYRGWDHLGTDSVYLASGEGDIEILSSNHVARKGIEQAEETDESGDTYLGDYYTKYVYEEGSTVEISVDTGFSGVRLNPDEEGYGNGWALEIYGPDGTRYKQWYPVPDNVRGKKYTYTIPDGSFEPGSDNEWRVVLRNTLFDQAETRVFVVDSFDYVPGKTTIYYNSQGLMEGDDLPITMTAMANPDGTGDIDHFYLIAKYGTSSSMVTVFLGKVDAVSGDSAYEYTAIKTINLPHRPNTKDNLYVRAHAVDSDGRTGGEGEKNAYVEQQVQQVNDDDGEGLPQMANEGLIWIILFIVIVAIVLILMMLYRTGRLDFLFQKGGGKR